VSDRTFCASAAFIAPQDECPQTTIFLTPSTRTAYSMALASETSLVEIPSASAGGTKLPTLRIVKRSQGCVEAKRSGTTRLSEQVIINVSGDWPNARARNRSAYRGRSL
jgi:hypothetical protein